MAKSNGTSTSAKDAIEHLKVNEQKWTKALLAGGWTCAPNVVIERQQALGLTPLDINILLHLWTYWWTPDNKPHPSKATIAKAIGIKPRSVQRRIAAMEAAGFISRHERRQKGKASKTNLYSFEGLIQHATPYAQEKVQERKANRAAKAATLKRKKPKLKLVPKDT